MAPQEATELQPLEERERPLARTRGLESPWAPATGTLVPTDIGWLLSRGTIEDRLAPSLRQRMQRISPAVGGAFGALAASLDPLALELAAFGGTIAVVTGLLGATKLIARRRLRALSDGAAARDSRPLFAQAPGEAARIAGVIAPGPTFPSLFRGQPCVLCHSSVGPAHEVRGQDFTVILDDGARVQIEARGGFLLDSPSALEGPPACGPVYGRGPQQKVPLGQIFSALDGPVPFFNRLIRWAPREASVGPGDHVEVMGVLHREVAPDGVAGPGRKTPMRLILRSSDTVPLCVRKLRE